MEDQPTVVSSADGAKVQQNSETTKDKEKKTLDYLSISAPIAEARDNQEFISAAKVQQNSEITKLSSKKELPPSNCRTLNLIAQPTAAARR